MRRIACFIVLMMIFGCGDRTEPLAPSPKSAAPAPAPPRDRPTEVEMVAWMEAHYSVVILAHDALLQGDLDSFRSQLALVSDHVPPAETPEEWLALEERLYEAAAAATRVSDLEAAAGAFGPVVFACGGCHVALARGPVYPAPAPDDGANPLEAAMLDHQWATERLWEGVTGPWDNAWQRGAASLESIQVFGEASGDIVLTDDLRRREQQLRDIGKEAQVTTGLEERAALYASLLSTCGDCHKAIGVTFDPAK